VVNAGLDQIPDIILACNTSNGSLSAKARHERLESFDSRRQHRLLQNNQCANYLRDVVTEQLVVRERCVALKQHAECVRRHRVRVSHLGKSQRLHEA
jgi:hypothetical protein